ncbi:MAG: polysulfide reductase NrfD [Candidatus Carbobacillus altaicus]|nr:polysulfide reductase NrfD [Candidatus Carbobacillus altaicus]
MDMATVYPYIDALNRPLWGWYITIYFFLAGVAVGSYFFTALLQLTVKPSPRRAWLGYILPFPLMAAGALLLILDLHTPDRFLRFYHLLFNPRDHVLQFKTSSVMSLGTWGISIFTALSALSFIYALLKWQGEKKGTSSPGMWQKLLVNLHEGSSRFAFLSLMIILAAFVGAYTGALLGATQWVVWAETPLLPLLFLISAGSTGLAALSLIHTASSDRVLLEGYERADTLLILLELLVLIVFVWALGPYATVFLTGLNAWILGLGVIALGLLLPLILRRWKQITVLAHILVLLGGFLLRYLIVIGAKHI